MNTAGFWVFQDRLRCRARSTAGWAALLLHTQKVWIQQVIVLNVQVCVNECLSPLKKTQNEKHKSQLGIDRAAAYWVKQITTNSGFVPLNLALFLCGKRLFFVT